MEFSEVLDHAAAGNVHAANGSLADRWNHEHAGTWTAISATDQTHTQTRSIGVVPNAHEARRLTFWDDNGTEHQVDLPNPNTNCLDGMRCPNCGQARSLNIEATVIVKVTDNGTDDTVDGWEWDDTSPCACSNCGHNATVAKFMESAS